jgi:hypothetical protein
MAGDGRIERENAVLDGERERERGREIAVNVCV